MYTPDDTDTDLILDTIRRKTGLEDVYEEDIFVIGHLNPADSLTYINAAEVSKDLVSFSDLMFFDTLEYDYFTDGVTLKNGIALVMLMHLKEDNSHQLDLVLTLDENGIIRIEDEKGDILYERD